MNKRLQFGLESSWGTAATATKRKPILTAHLEAGASVIESEGLDGNLVSEAAYQGAQVPRFTIDTEFNDADADLLLVDWMMGSQAYGAIGGTDSGGPPYTHTYITEEFLNSLTLEVVEDNIPATKCQRLLGAKVDEWKLRGAWSQGVEGICRASYSGTGKQLQTNQTPTGALTSDSLTPWLFSQLSTIDMGATSGSDIKLASFELTVTNSLPTIPNMGLNTQAEPVRAAFCKIDLKFTARFLSVAALDEFINFTEGSPQLGFTRGADTMTIDMPKGRIIDFGHPIQGPQLIEQAFTWRAFRAGGTPFTITIVNTVPTTA